MRSPSDSLIAWLRVPSMFVCVRYFLQIFHFISDVTECHCSSRDLQSSVRLEQWKNKYGIRYQTEGSQPDERQSLLSAHEVEAHFMIIFSLPIKFPECIVDIIGHNVFRAKLRYLQGSFTNFLLSGLEWLRVLKWNVSFWMPCHKDATILCRNDDVFIEGTCAASRRPAYDRTRSPRTASETGTEGRGERCSRKREEIIV